MLEFSLPEMLSTAIALSAVSVIVSLLVWQIGIILIGGVFGTFIFLAFCLYRTQRIAQNSFQKIDAEASAVILKGIDVIELVQSYVMQEYYLGRYKEVIRPAVR